MLVLVGTLGDLLYPDERKTPVPEKAWVALVQSIAAGDQLALHALYEQTHRIVFTLVMRIAGSRETAEELTVDVFHDVWRRAATYDPANGPVIGWIMNQARSRAIDRLRFEQRKKRVNGSPEIPAVTDEHGPDHAFELRDQGRVVRDALSVLTPAERLVQSGRGLAIGELREKRDLDGLPLGTVKTRLRSGLRKLREALAGTVTAR